METYNENTAILRIALDAANSGDTEAALMYADILRSNVVNGFDVAIVRAHTMIMSAVESYDARAKFREFDAIAQRTKDYATFIRQACTIAHCDNCGSGDITYVNGTLRKFCIHCGYRLNKERIALNARQARETLGLDIDGLSLELSRLERQFGRFV